MQRFQLGKKLPIFVSFILFNYWDLNQFRTRSSNLIEIHEVFLKRKKEKTIFTDE